MTSDKYFVLLDVRLFLLFVAARVVWATNRAHTAPIGSLNIIIV